MKRRGERRCEGDLAPQGAPGEGVTAVDGDMVGNRARRGSSARVGELVAEFMAAARKRRFLSWAMWGAVVMLAAGEEAGVLSWLPEPIFFPLAALAPILFGALMLFFMFPSKRQQAIAAELAQSKDVRAIGPLLVCLSAGTRATRRRVAPDLEGFLRRVQRSDADRISRSDLHLLQSRLGRAVRVCNRLTREVSWDDLDEAMLVAVAEIGDSRAIGIVQALAERARYSTAEDRIGSVAEQCLARLRERLNEGRVHAALLMPASDKEGNSDVLVRPAAGDSAVDPEMLLRPTEHDAG